MSGECDKCNEHCLDCKCKDDQDQDFTFISNRDLVDLIHWARRYCDKRASYCTYAFNKLYDYLVQVNPKIKEIDLLDRTLMEDGKYFPHAQDGMYNDRKGSFDARPIDSGSNARKF